MLLQKRLVLKISKTLISQEEIENKISEIAEIINNKYKDEEVYSTKYLGDKLGSSDFLTVKRVLNS